MHAKRHEPIEITPHFFQIGVPEFPAYLSLGKDGMIIEGGTGPTYSIMVDQIKMLGIDPNQIKYIILTHTHSDHIGAVPHFHHDYPDIKLLASPTGAKTLGRKELFKDFQVVDLGIAQLMKAKSEIDKLPKAVKHYTFKVDRIVQEGDRIDLGEGIVWTAYETPGHSPCHISLFEEKEGTLVLGDAAGFCVPEKDAIWPNYFESLEKYCDSLRKLAALLSKRGVLSHYGLITGDVRQFLKRTMEATEKYHHELLERLEKGEVLEDIAMEKARFVDSITDIQPFKIMYDLSKVLIKNSVQAGKIDHFGL
jgi:glyoxylase-like metal-dependent hydrolase (beta-lactamase superfamily II)